VNLLFDYGEIGELQKRTTTIPKDIEGILLLHSILKLKKPCNRKAFQNLVAEII
jgi:hypothetical protein